MKVLKRMKLMKGGRQTLTWPGFAGRLAAEGGPPRQRLPAPFMVFIRFTSFMISPPIPTTPACSCYRLDSQQHAHASFRVGAGSSTRATRNRWNGR